MPRRRYIKVFADDNGQDLLASGEVVACQEWNGDIAQVMVEDKDLDYAVPKEGTNIWEDTWAMPAGAPHPGKCPRLPELSCLMGKLARTSPTTVQYATPNAAAKKLMPPEYTGSSAIYPARRSARQMRVHASISAKRQQRCATKSGPAFRQPDFTLMRHRGRRLAVPVLIG